MSASKQTLSDYSERKCKNKKNPTNTENMICKLTFFHVRANSKHVGATLLTKPVVYAMLLFS
jgi:hypothetical protein